MVALPWRRLAAVALASTAACLALLVWNYRSTYDYMGGLVDAAPDAPGSELMNRDFPDGSQSKVGGNHDGAFFYAIARDVLDPLAAASYLDRPRYRLQRIAFPLAARALHPTGTGDGLVWSMLAVGVAGVVGGSLAMGALSVTLRGPWWIGGLFPLFTGSMLSLRISTPDPLALALALGAVAASLRARPRSALALAVLAVLTKETSWLVLAGFALWRRDRAGLALAFWPAAAGAAWYAWLHALPLPPGREPDVIEFGAPFAGWIDAAGFWRGVPANRDETLWYTGLLNVAAGVVFGFVALVRHRLCHPLSWAITIQLTLLTSLTWIPLAPERNGTRTVLPLLALATVAVATSGAQRPKSLKQEPPQELSPA